MNNFKVKQGSRFDFAVKTDDSYAESATLVMRDVDGGVYDFTEPFVENLAYFGDRDDITTLPNGVYEYQINENHETGLPDKFPDPDKCSDDCSFPTITICESLDEVES
jgi:hypothetical protein